MEFLILALGVLFLVKGADWFVGGAAALARYLRIPSIVVGLTIVALGTSLPELAVSLTAAVKGSNAIALGNVLGSNIVNLLMVIGLSALIHPIQVEPSVMKRDYSVSILMAVVLLFFLSDFLFHREMVLSRPDGVMLLGILGIYMVQMVSQALKGRPQADNLDMTHGVLWNVALCICGSVAIIIGGQMVVNGATEIARSFGLSETLIGLTIVAVGTSLPELVTSVVAAKKGESDIALGNVVGSNIMNIGFILGVSAGISPIRVEPENVYDAAILLAVSLFFFLPLYARKRVTRGTGAMMVLVYVIYTGYILMR
ncbi:MAG: calcium/sodium antiporter [Lachnospiraceae bacterium]|nr:calcium/sodium antiporter [Lachnospiraceae bacterium]